MPSRTHGHAGNSRRANPGRARTYTIWANMIQRCTNPHRQEWPRYGGRGITVCDRWRVYENFLVDVGHAPEGMTLDRVRNDEGYGPDNWRWATQRVQCRNKSSTVMVTINGITKPRIEWCEQYGIDEIVVRMRINRNKWDPVRAITTPNLGARRA